MNELMQRRRALMAMATATGVKITKTVFNVTTAMTTTGSGGNTQNFKNLYGGTERGVYVYDVTNNGTSNGYARGAYRDYRTGHDLFMFNRYTGNNITTSVQNNYDAFLDEGAVVTRWFIPEEAFV